MGDRVVDVMEAIDASGYESAMEDARGIAMCSECENNHVHSPDSNKCIRCES